MEAPKREDAQAEGTPLQQPRRGNHKLEGTVLEDTQLTLVDRIRQHAHPIQGRPEDYNLLLRAIGDARFVLLGDASHGTHEFYQARAEITRRLIEEKGFTAVAVEADWPDAYRVNRYVQQRSDGATAVDSLSAFTRFPGWMWRNRPVLDFVQWLHDHNAGLAEGQARTGFYGLDLYSLNQSMDAVVAYLDKADPEAAQRARYRYSCFEHFGEDPQTYGYAANFDLTSSCEKEVVAQLTDLRQQAYDLLHRDGFVAEDEFFFAEQNARIARNAEEYYRAMFAGDVVSWNLRDRHMMETLEALVAHLERRNKPDQGLPRQALPVKVVVWAHNSHLGDARATELSRRGELNLGQLVRTHYKGECAAIGCTTYAGTVTAAADWDGPAGRKRLRPALNGSFEWLFHYTGLPRFFLLLAGMKEALSDLGEEKLERAIGVVYRPETERTSHYFSARLMDQFDAVLHFDETTALEPLERASQWEQGDPPETYPTGM